MRARVWFRIHGRMFSAGWRRGSTYRAAALGGLVANAVFGFLKASVLVAAVRAGGGDIGGYDATAIVAYTWLGQALLGSVNLNGRSDLATRMKDGSIAVDLLRPVDLQTATTAQDLGRALFSLLPRGVPLIALGVLAGGMRLPLDPLILALGAFSVVAGTTLSYLVVYLVAVAGFWIVETRGLQTAYMIVSGFLAGLFVPVTLFPGWLLTLARATPFPSMLQTPIDVLSGRLTGAESAQAVLVQLAWITGVLVVGQVVTGAGRRRLEVQGG
ncbi:ABC transporter permease [Kineosporia succinea]|uniref:ABC-2 type transport system permease protein n=1 Tax=Kineosporia succinea TaxID=84632 RepID=A0ABT9PAB0_9ACTN|nr:ABC-2 family transporter protein [Kineosporia succinea]MDP9829628.1 ABC-2 type transport system permease protein [Kineosporia succinea]